MTHAAQFRLVVGLQLLVLLGLAGTKLLTLTTGQPVTLLAYPVDPRDLFRGDYVALRYEVSNPDQRLWKEPSYEVGDRIYATLRRQGRYWRAAAVSRQAPRDGSIFLRGRVRTVDGSRIGVRYGLESYFVPEGEGRELEAVGSGGTRALAVEVVVDRAGRAVIRGVSVAPK